MEPPRPRRAVGRGRRVRERREHAEARREQRLLARRGTHETRQEGRSGFLQGPARQGRRLQGLLLRDGNGADRRTRREELSPRYGYDGVSSMRDTIFIQSDPKQLRGSASSPTLSSVAPARNLLPVSAGLQRAQRFAIMPSRRVSHTFTPLADAGLGIDRAGLLAAMEPFVARQLAPTDPAWQAEVARKSAKTKRQLRKRRWLGWLARPAPRSATDRGRVRRVLGAQAPRALRHGAATDVRRRVAVRRRRHVRDQRRRLAGAPARPHARDRVAPPAHRARGRLRQRAQPARPWPAAFRRSASRASSSPRAALPSRARAAGSAAARGAAALRARAAGRPDRAPRRRVSPRERRGPAVRRRQLRPRVLVARARADGAGAGAGDRRDGARERPAHAHARAVLGLQRQRALAATTS